MCRFRVCVKPCKTDKRIEMAFGGGRIRADPRNHVLDGRRHLANTNDGSVRRRRRLLYQLVASHSPIHKINLTKCARLNLNHAARTFSGTAPHSAARHRARCEHSFRRLRRGGGGGGGDAFFIVRRVLRLWCSKRRFVYRTRKGDGAVETDLCGTATVCSS